MFHAGARERERESGEGFLLKPQNSTAHAIPTLRHRVCLYVCRKRERERERERERRGGRTAKVPGFCLPTTRFI